MCPLFDLVVCFSGIELLVYFGDNPLSVVSFAVIFSHSEGCLFTLVVSFALQKLLKKMIDILEYIWSDKRFVNHTHEEHVKY